MKTNTGQAAIPEHGTCAGIYIHIPFCVRKCAYCDFLSGPADAAVQKAYVERLSRELADTCNRMKTEGQRISTVYIGGGTPSILPGEDILQLMEVLRRHGTVLPDAEITLEMNPGTVTVEKLEYYRMGGINRLSIGAQSFQEEELKLLGRIHTREDFFHAYEMARRAGFSNISLDLMSGLPGQTPQNWRNSLQTAVSLNPEHISAYSLIIEEGTPFYERYGENWSEENEETDRQMYEDTGRILQDAGYFRYEISNYAKPGRESRHNSSYWTGIPYYGCGLGASSLVRQPDGWHRIRNQSDLKSYLVEKTVTPEEDLLLTEQERMEEFMFLGLRLVKGISIREFEERFHRNFHSIYGNAVQELKKDGLLMQNAGRIALTERGLDLSNYCFEKFLIS